MSQEHGQHSEHSGAVAPTGTLVDASQARLKKGSLWQKLIFVGLAVGIACLAGAGYLYSQSVHQLKTAEEAFRGVREAVAESIELYDEQGSQQLSKAEVAKISAEQSLKAAESVVLLFQERSQSVMKQAGQGPGESVNVEAKVQKLEQVAKQVEQLSDELAKVEASMRQTQAEYDRARKRFAQAQKRVDVAKKVGKGSESASFLDAAAKSFASAKAALKAASQPYAETAEKLGAAVEEQARAQADVAIATMTPAQFARAHVKAKSELNSARSKLRDANQAAVQTFKAAAKNVNPELRKQYEAAEAAFYVAKDAKHQFWYSYLTAFMFFLSLGLGGLFFCIVQHLTRAGWSIVVRRIAENIMITLPFVCLLGLPLLLGSHDLFHWTHEELVRTDVMLAAKSGYLNLDFFHLRLAAYAVVWTGLALVFYRWSTTQDHAQGQAIDRASHKMRWFAAPALVLFAISATFAAFDLLMSLDPHWFSTMFGVYFFAGSVLTIHALLAVLVISLRASGYLKNIVTVEHYHDLGKLMFGFTVFWAYIAFSQYFLIWYSNIPEETMWFAYRIADDFFVLTAVVVFGRFIIPFFFLLQRSVKRNRSLLLLAGLWIVVMQFVDLYWLTQPVLAHHFAAETGHHHMELFVGSIDYLTLFGIGGIFVAVVCWALGRHALVPLKDPRLGESLHFENF